METASASRSAWVVRCPWLLALSSCRLTLGGRGDGSGASISATPVGHLDPVASIWLPPLPHPGHAGRWGLTK